MNELNPLEIATLLVSLAIIATAIVGLAELLLKRIRARRIDNEAKSMARRLNIAPDAFDGFADAVGMDNARRIVENLNALDDLREELDALHEFVSDARGRIYKEGGDATD